MAPAAALANGTTESHDLLPSDEDLLYEEELLRNPFALKMWYVFAASPALSLLHAWRRPTHLQCMQVAVSGGAQGRATPEAVRFV